MADVRRNPMVRDLAEFALHFRDHPDVAELQRRGNALLEAEGSDADLVSLAASFPDGEDADLLAELERSAREVLAQQAPMSRRSRTLIGAYLLALGLAVIAALPWAWSFSTALADGQAGVRAHFLGLGFDPTPAFSEIVIVILTAMAASVAVMSLVFSARAGKHTLEEGWEWWYITRPVTAAIVGVVSFMAILAGFFDAPTGTDRPELVIAAAVGGLSGLFTDKIIEKLGKLIGATDPRTFTRPRT
jgi:hypothetical protein